MKLVKYDWFVFPTAAPFGSESYISCQSPQALVSRCWGTDAGAKTAAPAAAEAKPKQEPLPEVEIGLKELPVVLNDSTGKIKASGR